MTKAQKIADIMMQDMFAPHELPVDADLAAKYLNLANKVLAALPQTSQEPVMWRCKDYADGWITFEREDSAQRYQAQTGCLMQPLYAGMIPLSVSRPDRKSNA